MASQESVVLLSWSNTGSPVPGNSRETYVLAFPTFTVSDQKKLVFHIEEKKGERTILLDIPARTLVKARGMQ